MDDRTLPFLSLVVPVVSSGSLQFIDLPANFPSIIQAAQDKVAEDAITESQMSKWICDSIIRRVPRDLKLLKNYWTSVSRVEEVKETLITIGSSSYNHRWTSVGDTSLIDEWLGADSDVITLEAKRLHYIMRTPVISISEVLRSRAYRKYVLDAADRLKKNNSDYRFLLDCVPDDVYNYFINDMCQQLPIIAANLCNRAILKLESEGSDLIQDPVRLWHNMKSACFSVDILTNMYVNTLIFPEDQRNDYLDLCASCLVASDDGISRLLDEYPEYPTFSFNVSVSQVVDSASSVSQSSTEPYGVRDTNCTFFKCPVKLMHAADYQKNIGSCSFVCLLKPNIYDVVGVELNDDLTDCVSLVDGKARLIKVCLAERLLLRALDLSLTLSLLIDVELAVAQYSDQIESEFMVLARTLTERASLNVSDLAKSVKKFELSRDAWIRMLTEGMARVISNYKNSNGRLTRRNESVKPSLAMVLAEMN